MSQDHGIAITSVDPAENVEMFEPQIRQNIPTKKQLVDPYRQGIMTEEGVGYRQIVVIRSYEVGPDKTATIESILSLLQVMKRKSHFNGYQGNCVSMLRFLNWIFIHAGNSVESCMDVRASKRRVWRHPWNDEKQSYLGCFKNASSSGSLSNLVLMFITVNINFLHRSYFQ